MRERKHFIRSVLDGSYTPAEASAIHGVSRKTGYKWWGRFEEGGYEALDDRSRAPRKHPNRLLPEVEKAIVEARRRHPSWGAKKLLWLLSERRPKQALPALSTANEVLRRNGLQARRSRRRKVERRRCELTAPSSPNQIWAIDFKGQFRTGDGVLCFPLTVSDLYSRCILLCTALPSIRSSGVRRVMERLLRKRGLPEWIRSDNGKPFSSTGFLGLSALNVWWAEHGIRHELIEPGHPQQNGSHERMHRTLKDETTRPPARTMKAQQRRFDRFCREFNEERPHEALGQVPPIRLWQPSPRRYQVPTDFKHPGHYEIRRVRSDGTIKLSGKHIFVSETLVGRQLGLEEVDDGLWSLYLRDYLLARWNERLSKLYPAGTAIVRIRTSDRRPPE
jgi:putative transposase